MYRSEAITAEQQKYAEIIAQKEKYNLQQKYKEITAQKEQYNFRMQWAMERIETLLASDAPVIFCAADGETPPKEADGLRGRRQYAIAHGACFYQICSRVMEFPTPVAPPRMFQKVVAK